MTAQIIDRGRGPEIAGSRVTVFRIMDYLREGAGPGRMATELELTPEQVAVALEYIEANRTAVDSGYEAILQRQVRPPEATSQASTSPDDLKARIRSRCGAEAADAGPLRQ